MRKFVMITFYLVGVIFFQSVGAQSTVLLEACNAIQDSIKRLECLKEISKTPQAQSSKSDTSIKRMIEAIGSINSAIDSQVSFNQFQQLRFELAKEVGVYRSSSAQNAKAAALLSEAVAVYTDAETLWGAGIRYRRTVFDMREIDSIGIGDVVSRHNIPMVRIGYQGPQPAVFNQYGFHLADGLRQLSKLARSKTNDAMEIMRE
jgi:hypothetical protein